MGLRRSSGDAISWEVGRWKVEEKARILDSPESGAERSKQSFFRILLHFVTGPNVDNNIATVQSKVCSIIYGMQ
jgi:hypothetical protein